MTTRLQNKVALVTGGTSGIGLATAKRFAEEGARVFITGRRQAELDKAVGAIPEATGVRGDISKLDDIDRLASIIKQEAGRLDILFANAGGGAFAPIQDVTEEHFDKYFGINVKGAVFTVQKMLPLMPSGSAIVVNGSNTSVRGIPAFGVYAATKAALRSFVRTWSAELKPRNIRVNIIHPGTVVTAGYKAELGLSDEEIKGLVDATAASNAVGRTGTPDEIASAVLFLATDDSSYIAGVELFVDGGETQI
ncbi:MAG: SDR family oxidoreductase [Phycisphaerales bacterium]